MKDNKNNILKKNEHICSECGVGCYHHSDNEAKYCLKKKFSGFIDIEDWYNN